MRRTAGGSGWPSRSRAPATADALSDEVARSWTLAVGAADLDDDLLPEIYFANDFGPDRLLHNLSTPGHLRFRLLEGEQGWRTPHSKVLGRDSFKGMGVDFGDVNGDGLLDIYVSNIADEYALEESHFVWVNTGRTELMKKGVAPFVDRSEELGLARSGWGWDARLVDFDNDGVPEAVQATGFVRGGTNRWPELQEVAMTNDQLQGSLRIWPRFQPGDDLSGHGHDPFFVRAADGRYYDLAADLNLDQPQITRGVAVADVDGDGRLDFALANQWMPSYLYLNRSRQAGSFLGLNLLLPAGGPRAGAKTTERPGLPGAELRGYPAYGMELLLGSVEAWAHKRRPKFLGGPRRFVDFLLPAHITALAVAMLLYADEQYWMIAFATAAAISSKLLLRAPVGRGRRHFFNPSNFGITATLLLFPVVGITPPYQFTEHLGAAGDLVLPGIIICTGT